MESLFSLLGLYQLSALIVPGAVVTGVSYYAIEGLPPNPSAAAVLGLIVVFYLAGNVIQGTAVLWESKYWSAVGGWPSTSRMTASDKRSYESGFRDLVQKKLDGLVGESTSGIPVRDRFGLARGELRRLGQDSRAESFNAIYGLSRGVATATLICFVTLIVCVLVGHETNRNLVTAAIVGVSFVPVMVRFHRFGFYFADQVWHDFVALTPRANASPLPSSAEPQSA